MGFQIGYKIVGIIPFDDTERGGVRLEFDGTPHMGFGAVAISDRYEKGTEVIFALATGNDIHVVGNISVDGQDIILIKESGIIASKFMPNTTQEFTFGD